MDNRRNLAAAMMLIGTIAMPGSSDATPLDLVQSDLVLAQFTSAHIPVKAFSASTSKNEPNLARGDVVLVDLRQAGILPARGDLIVFGLGPNPHHVERDIARVIGLPGDRFAMRDGRIILNGKEVEQQAIGRVEYDDSDGKKVSRKLFVETLPGATPYKVARWINEGGFDVGSHNEIVETVIETGHLYVLGDNRDNSLDSRIFGIGQIDIKGVIGRIVYRIQPNNGWLVPRGTVPDLPKE
jgi:signal peptidase I